MSASIACERSEEYSTLDQQRSVQDRLCHEFLGASLDTLLNYINRSTRQGLGCASVLELSNRLVRIQCDQRLLLA